MMSDTPISILNQYWHFNSFQGQQESIINAVLAGNDVLALMPTGGGKSICFQVPAMLSEGLCIVVTPLIALMQDQVAGLLQKSIPAAAIHSGLSLDEVHTILENADQEAYKFLYVAPERLETDLFLDYLPSLYINIIAVDEAHCISQWGHDFRPSYLKIAQIRKHAPKAPIIALTATATKPVQADIVKYLGFKDYQIFTQSFHRPNLHFSAVDCENKLYTAIQLTKQIKGSIIIYCKSRRLTKEVAAMLQTQGIKADFYHAGLTQEERSTKQDKWIKNKIQIIVCTNAFGMGIDKADVQAVIHYDSPDCLENYVQEAGRAGRNGANANATLLYTQQDLDDLQQLPELRFPPIQIIKKIYQNLCDFLQIPVGIGEGNYYDFDLNNFIKNFHLNAVQTVSAIKALEQAELMQFTESIFLPSKVCFTTDKDTLYLFEEKFAQLEPIIKFLLRNYEGIFSYKVSVFEKYIAKRLRLTIAEVVNQLQLLQQYHLITYLPQKETPQIHFLANRASTEFLLFNQNDYLKRKKAFEKRVEKMLYYIASSKCRSKLICQYFDDHQATNCGVCDNCKQNQPSDTAINSRKVLRKKIIALLVQQPTDYATLIDNLSSFSEEEIKTAVYLLQSEGILTADIKNVLRLN